MNRMVTLARFLLDHPRLAIEQDSIHEMRSRAKRQGKPDPYPWVISRGRGTPALVRFDAAQEWAASEGKSHIFEGREGR